MSECAPVRRPRSARMPTPRRPSAGLKNHAERDAIASVAVEMFDVNRGHVHQSATLDEHS